MKTQVGITHVFFFFLKNKEQKQLDGIKGEEDDVVGTYGRDEK